eukprot:maker-scaffold_48-snap-gene-0.38-mRNA-1 protein AED:0.42 eAED:0.42 QI:125/0.66/0.75/1/0/0/4/18/97
MARLNRLVLLVRDIETSIKFYNGLLNIPVQTVSDKISEASVGYSPFISFDVENINEIIPQAIQQGANLDGPIQHNLSSTSAVLRSPDGHIIALTQST